MSNASEDKQKLTAGLLAVWVLRFGVGLAVAIGGWGLRESWAYARELDGRVKHVELWKAEVSGNRFTAQNGQEVWQEIGRIRADIAKLPVTGEPPKWLVDQLTELKTELRETNRRLTALEATIQTHMAQHGGKQ